jgi:hypothetical protein
MTPPLEATPSPDEIEIEPESVSEAPVAILIDPVLLACDRDINEISPSLSIDTDPASSVDAPVERCKEPERTPFPVDTSKDPPVRLLEPAITFTPPASPVESPVITRILPLDS